TIPKFTRLRPSEKQLGSILPAAPVVPAQLAYPARSSPVATGAADPLGYVVVADSFDFWFLDFLSTFGFCLSDFSSVQRPQALPLARRRAPRVRRADGAQRQHHLAPERSGTHLSLATPGLRGSRRAVGGAGRARSGPLVEAVCAVALLEHVRAARR